MNVKNNAGVLKQVYLFQRITIGIFQHINMVKQQINSRGGNSTVKKAWFKDILIEKLSTYVMIIVIWADTAYLLGNKSTKVSRK